jgi:beta-1,4-mannosyl-glycoprotein beta-1,4-N-acetylglucosaminyltransferase
MIYDCFMFFDELDILDIRLHELSSVVDRFVLVEATKTFSGNPKPLYYADNKEMFREFNDRIIHIVVDDMPEGDDPWPREKFQRNACMRGLATAQPDDIIIIGDVDEIPRAEKVLEIGTEHKQYQFALSNRARFLNVYLLDDPPWNNGQAVRFKDIITPWHVRDFSGNKFTINNAGWHFSYMGGAASILKKIMAVSHTEFAVPPFTDLDHIQYSINSGKDFFERGCRGWASTPSIADLPKYVLDHLNRFSYLISNVPPPIKIDVICNDGSPLGVSLKTLKGDDLQQVGCGGAEYALLTMCEAWQNGNYKVRLYNNPRTPTDSNFEQLPIDTFSPQDERDILLVFRSPNRKVDGARGKKVWWSCDQWTVGSFKDFAPHVDKIVTISPFHADYFMQKYGIGNTITIDLPVRTWEYQQKVDPILHRCLFSSVPGRGLSGLLTMWPQIVSRVPDASLVITSDYRLWGVNGTGMEPYLARALSNASIQVLGAIRRDKLVEEQLKAQLLVYPSSYEGEELFCIAVAESQVAGNWPVTYDRGALRTTNMGTLVPEVPEVFVNAVVENLLDPTLAQRQKELQAKAISRFNVERIMDEWKTKVFA